MMSGVRSENTKPELILRRELHRMGLRYRLHVKDLPGKPDLVFPRYRTVVFVNGCFWHQHKGCKKATIPTTRRNWWKEKLEGNVIRDEKVRHTLRELGWKVFIVWECEVTKSTQKVATVLEEQITS